MNNHFVDNSLLSMTTEKESISTAMKFLSLFFKPLGVIVSDHKTNYWIIGLDNPPKWIATT